MKPLEKFDLNRTAIVITIKQPLIEWAEQHYPEAIWDYTIFEGDVYLVADMGDSEEMEDWLRRNFSRIFTDQLHSWMKDPALWPKKYSDRYLT